MEELWKPVTGYEGLYEVSNLGHVKRTQSTVVSKNGVVKHIKSRLLKPLRFDGAGNYLGVTLSKNGIQSRKSIHRLVAFAFVENPNPSEFVEVNHKNENKHDNRACNLEWCSHSYNNSYGTLPMRKSTKSGKPVIQFINGKPINRWPSATWASKATGIPQSGIRMCCLGICHTSGGYKWKFA